MGPPLWNRINAEKFRIRHLDSTLPGPYIKGGRYEMEVAREFTKACDLLSSEALLQTSLGKHVRQSLLQGWQVKAGADCWKPEFASFIAGFFERCSPLVRIQQKI
jgi:tRNA nucleotidyltransferase (CCA-adding enzyme)